jgi:hypothetical protein
MINNMSGEVCSLLNCGEHGRFRGKRFEMLGGIDTAKSLILLVPKEGVEPSWPQGPRDLESQTQHCDLFRDSLRAIHKRFYLGAQG